jgi:putative transposase
MVDGGDRGELMQKRSMSQKLRMDARDYAAPGWYFVTLGADYHRAVFGTVEGIEMQPNGLGRLVEECWDQIPQHYGHIELGGRQVMPTHFHGLVRITRAGGKGLGEVMNVFKGAVTREWHKRESRFSEKEPVESRFSEKVLGEKERDSRFSEKLLSEKVRPVWAPNYYDVICFGAEELEVRERYIADNPRRWALRELPEGRIKRSHYRGNTALLQELGPRRVLRVSRRASTEAIAALQRELATFDGVVYSTFFSPGERACLEGLQRGTARLVWVLPMGMPIAVPVGWTRPFLEQRALWLSAFPDEQHEATRSSCDAANLWVRMAVGLGMGRGWGGDGELMVDG